jgi:hypothetical protein
MTPPAARKRARPPPSARPCGAGGARISTNGCAPKSITNKDGAPGRLLHAADFTHHDRPSVDALAVDVSANARPNGSAPSTRSSGGPLYGTGATRQTAQSCTGMPPSRGTPWLLPQQAWHERRDQQDRVQSHPCEKSTATPVPRLRIACDHPVEALPAKNSRPAVKFGVELDVPATLQLFPVILNSVRSPAPRPRRAQTRVRRQVEPFQRGPLTYKVVSNVTLRGSVK